MSQDEVWLLKEKYGGTESSAFRADLERLRAGEPLAYLIGHTPFLDCKIYLDSHPLIPRTETEYWVEKAIESILMDSKSDTTVLDLCAGSGCVGVAVARNVPDAQVTFTEIDSSHFPTIKKNLELNLSDYSDRMEHLQVLQSDLFQNVTGKFDFILTNPPYIDPALDRTENSVKRHEPHLALYGGESGFAIITDIIKEAPGYLNNAGQLWIEHEPEQVEAIHSLASAYDFLVVTHKDQYGVERFSVLTLSQTK